MGPTPLALALDELADAVAVAATTLDTAGPAAQRAAAALATVVEDLERAADAPLGPAGSDALVVLLRRVQRAHRVLLRAAAGRPGEPGPDLTVDEVCDLTRRVRAAASPAEAPVALRPAAPLVSAVGG